VTTTRFPRESRTAALLVGAPIAVWDRLSSMSIRTRSAALALVVVLGSVRCTTFGSSEVPLDASAASPDGSASPAIDSGLADGGGREDAEIAACPGVTVGKKAPCAGPCPVEEIAALPTDVYPFAFAATADAFYWVEHATGNAMAGAGDRGVLKRRRHDGMGGVETVLTNIDKAPRYAAIAGGAIWLVRDPAFSERVLRVPLDCSAACAGARELGNQRTFHSIAAFGQGVAVGANDEVFAFDSMGNPLPSIPLSDLGPDGDLASLDGRLVAGTSRRESPFLELLGPAEQLRLPTTLPDGPGAPKAVTEVAADCTGVWAIQLFDTGHLLARAIRGGPPSAYALAGKSLPSALEADSTHAYLAIPNAGGLYRTDGTKLTELARGNVWSVAVAAEWVYFDDHTSRKILRRPK
jgi:hypothetical protein